MNQDMNSRRLFLFTLASGLIAPAFATEFSHASWDAMLKKFVSVIPAGQVGLATQVDYLGFAKDRANLRHYLSSLSSIPVSEFRRWTSQQQLAFLINAYNAWTVDLILSAEEKISSIKDLGNLFKSPWKKKFIPLFGEIRSLDDLEHGLIRGTDGSGGYGDPRIHFAVNCASIGCPALRNEAYLAEKLEAQLEDATLVFLADTSRNRLETDALKISSLFKWYKADFEKGWRGTRTVHQFLARYGRAFGFDKQSSAALANGSLAIEFLDYDWRLNSKAVKP